jgi:cytochrome P450
VAWSVYHMHRLTSVYGADASEFRPERWEGTNLEKEVGWGFMPFHGGPRMCLGSKFFPFFAGSGPMGSFVS